MELPNMPNLNKIVELVLQKGIYNSIKAVLENSFMRNIVAKEFNKISETFKKNYDVIGQSIKINEEEGKVVIDLFVEDEEKREELKDRTLDALKRAQGYAVVKSFISEFEIKDMECRLISDGVRFTIYGNEKFIDLVKSLGGDLVEEEG